ncbi:hypothetical protein F5146DRAFT_923588 [Armillaria mellea]|nr:hypothetical protein F5146DRAFT_923588 [Armillaria mellea]
MVAIELALCMLKSGGYANVHIKLCFNNQGIMGALKVGYFRGTQQNDIVRRIVTIMQQEKIWLTIKWISTHNNLADDPLRGKFRPCKLIYPFPLKVHLHLKKFVANSIQCNNPRLEM